MKISITRKRLAMSFAVLGVVLMGVDLLITRNFFTHVGELMVASILCFVIGIVLDRDPGKTGKEERNHHARPAKGSRPPEKGCYLRSKG